MLTKTLVWLLGDHSFKSWLSHTFFHTSFDLNKLSLTIKEWYCFFKYLVQALYIHTITGNLSQISLTLGSNWEAVTTTENCCYDYDWLPSKLSVVVPGSLSSVAGWQAETCFYCFCDSVAASIKDPGVPAFLCYMGGWPLDQKWEMGEFYVRKKISEWWVKNAFDFVETS